MGVAFDDSVAAAIEWVEAADPRPTFPMLLDRELLLGELYGIYNVPTRDLDRRGRPHRTRAGDRTR